MNKSKYEISDHFENDDEEENEPDWEAMKDNGECPYCYSDLAYCLLSSGDRGFCEMCGMEL